MKRREFLYTIGGISLLATAPALGQNMTKQEYTRDILIGKGSPEFRGEGFKMHPKAYGAFLRMKEEALKAGFRIEVVSAYRSFQRQKEIFENKYIRFTDEGDSPQEAIDRIIEYSTIPGTSRHHWGTDIDIIDGNAPRPDSVLQARHFHGNGPFCKMKEWLNLHAEGFGFVEVYTDEPGRKGFKYEPWHFSFADVSKPMLNAYRKLDLKQILQQEKIKGSEFFTEDFISDYQNRNILDINPKLL